MKSTPDLSRSAVPQSVPSETVDTSCQVKNRSTAWSNPGVCSGGIKAFFNALWARLMHGKQIEVQNERKNVTPNLARYIRIARHRIFGTPLDEENRIEEQRASAIEEFQIYIARKIDISIRMELFVPANWCWDDATGASVQFSVDGHSFVLAQQKDGCHLFLEADGSKIPLAVLPDQDRQQFTDRLLIEISDALERTSLP